LREGEVVATAVDGTMIGAMMRVLNDENFDYTSDRVMVGFLTEYVTVSAGEAKWNG